jgi:hypothetical protein
VRIVFGWAKRKDIPHAVDITAAGLTLCRIGVFWLPGILGGFSGEMPPNLCGRCRQLMVERGAVVVLDDQREGTCPECVGRAPLTQAGADRRASAVVVCDGSAAGVRGGVCG